MAAEHVALLSPPGKAPNLPLPAKLEIECIEIGRQVEQVGGDSGESEWLDDEGVELARGCSGRAGESADIEHGPCPAHVAQDAGEGLKRVKPKIWGDDTVDTHPNSVRPESPDHTHEAGHKVAPHLLALFFLGAVLGASPRAIALLSIAQMTPAPALETSDDLKFVFAPCKEQGQAFTNISPDGLQYRALIQTDHAFYVLGLTMCYIGLLIIISPSIVWKARDWQCRCYKVVLGVCIAGQVGNMCYLLWKESRVYSGTMSLAITFSELWILDDFIYVSLASFCGSYLLLVNCEAALLSNSHEVWRPCRGDGAARFCFNAFFCMTIVAHFSFLIWGGLYPKDADRKHLSVMEAMYYSLASRALNGILRGLCIYNIDFVTRRTVLCVNLIGVLLISTTTVAIRQRGIEYSDNDFVDAALSSLLLGISEIICFVLFVTFNQFSIAKRFKDINFMTLSGALDAHSIAQKQMHMFYGHVWSEESAEIFVCVVITAQELAMPVWNQYRTFHSLADHAANGAVRSMVILIIRLVFEFGIGWVLLTWCRKRMPTNFRQMLRRSMSKSVVCCYLGIVMYTMVCFWPRCHICGNPQQCLLFLMCLCRGKIMLDGQNACRSDFGWTAQGIEDLLQVSNISKSDLGCDRPDVICPTYKHLLPGQVCSRDDWCQDPIDPYNFYNNSD